MGGAGGGIAYNHEEFENIIKSGLDASPIGEVLIDEPHPRNDDFRTSEKFVGYCAEASRLLKIGMSEDAAA